MDGIWYIAIYIKIANVGIKHSGSYINLAINSGVSTPRL